MKRLIEMADKQIRDELEDYYIVPKSRLENIMICFETGAARIKELTTKVADQQEEIARLVRQIMDEE